MRTASNSSYKTAGQHQTIVTPLNRCRGKEMIDHRSSMYLEHFQWQRRRLISLSERLLKVLETLDIPVLYDEVRTQIGRLQTDTLKVLVVGEFNTGKSTVLNALLGQKILPAYPVPTTALLTE